MTVARSQLVDLDVTSYYHCISRCDRRAKLCGEGNEHRKQWIEDRLEELAGIFAVSVAGFSVLECVLPEAAPGGRRPPRGQPQRLPRLDAG